MSYTEICGSAKP